jgi:nucleotide-binding universal stress UspA family protein
MTTSLKQLLVHLDASPQAAQRLGAACRLGQAHGAAVTALYAVTPGFVELPFAPEIGPGVAASLHERDDELRTRARAAYDKVLATPGMKASWAEVGNDPIMGVFAQQALYADLLVLGQAAPAEKRADGVPADFVESVLVSSGKPALILPYIGAPSTIGETVVVAWKPTREAARAVSAALPLLQRAAQVHVLSWSEEDEAVGGEGLSLGGYFQLQGVKAIWHREIPEPELLGELLLSRAFDLEADLLVMGCYGHSRAREWVLGGTSRTVLRSMTLPVLLAH